MRSLAWLVMMILRPRHVSAASGLSMTSVEDGSRALHKKKNSGAERMMGDSNKGDGVVSSFRKQRLFRGQRRQDNNSSSRSSSAPRTLKTQVALWTCCGGCMLFLSLALIFACCRVVAMRRVVVVPTAERAGRRGDGGDGEGTNSGRTTATNNGALFTVLVNTFERPRQLEEAVQHYAECQG